MNDIKDWITILITGVPLLALAGTMIGYLFSRQREAEMNEYSNYLKMINGLGAKDSSMAGNIATAYMLRNYPKYAKSTERVAAQVSKNFEQTPLIEELSDTVEWLRISGKL